MPIWKCNTLCNRVEHTEVVFSPPETVRPMCRMSRFLYRTDEGLPLLDYHSISSCDGRALNRGDTTECSTIIRMAKNYDPFKPAIHDTPIVQYNTAQDVLMLYYSTTTNLHDTRVSKSWYPTSTCIVQSQYTNMAPAETVGFVFSWFLSRFSDFPVP